MKNNICIIGMGYVGLTLAGVCLKSGHNVTGVELQDEIKQTINNGKAHFYEPGLNEILKSAVLSKKLHCIHPNEHKKISNCEIFIITVGTPLIPGTENPNLKYIKSALDTIIPYLDENKLIVLRSTIVVGLTRSEVIPHIIKNSNLLESQINISFAPERTVEGNALSELTDLPQVIGYNNPVAKQLAVNFFRSYVNDIKLVDSIEAAELVKLFNNVYRDLNFSIGNAFNDISKYYNLDGYKIIEAANYNYDRSRIALPGFVGGPCLEKDSYILCNNLKNDKLSNFIINGRKFNESQEDNTVDWILERFQLNDKILLTGMAFKGKPDTGDLRGSSSVKIYKKLKNLGFNNIYIHDFIALHNELSELGSTKVINDITYAENDFKLLAILNNNIRYTDKNFVSWLSNRDGEVLDIWNITKLLNINTIGNI
jgi:nucleotide sugar dehydrogenase